MKNLLPKRLKWYHFGRFTKERSYNGKVDTFDFLGFTHYCGKSKKGNFRVKRKTAKKKFYAKVKEMKVWIKEHRYLKIAEMIKQIKKKLRGHYQYYGITDNGNSINLFKRCINKLLWKWLNRRSERKSYTKEQFKIVMKQNPLLTPKIYINIYDIYGV